MYISIIESRTALIHALLLRICIKMTSKILIFFQYELQARCLGQVDQTCGLFRVHQSPNSRFSDGSPRSEIFKIFIVRTLRCSCCLACSLFVPYSANFEIFQPEQSEQSNSFYQLFGVR